MPRDFDSVLWADERRLRAELAWADAVERDARERSAVSDLARQAARARLEHARRGAMLARAGWNVPTPLRVAVAALWASLALHALF